MSGGFVATWPRGSRLARCGLCDVKPWHSDWVPDPLASLVCHLWVAHGVKAPAVERIDVYDDEDAK